MGRTDQIFLTRLTTMTTSPRNRIVVFRLSQDEYRMLKEACDRRGGRNVSDFTRSEVLEFLHSGTVNGPLHRRVRAIEQVITSLQSQFNSLLQGVPNAETKTEQ